MSTIQFTFPNGFKASGVVMEQEEPECAAQLWELLKDEPVKMECYHTLSAGGFFSAHPRPPREPIPSGSQIKSIGKKAPLIYDFEPGDISWVGRRLCITYGSSTEPMPVGGPIIAKICQDDLPGFITACEDIWFHCYIYHKLAIITAEKGE